MSKQRFTLEFKDEAVRQISERGYAVSEVSELSAHSLYKWVKAVKPDKTEQHTRELVEAKGEILKLRAQLRRTEEERDILKKAAGCLVDGGLAPPTAAASAGALRSRLAIRERRLATLLSFQQPGAAHESARQLLGQRGGGVIL
jgi:transposase